MPELNHKFQAGRMNKDLDERLVPNGEYRDALNVEVATSESSNVGSLQTIMGNIGLSSMSIKPFTNPVTGKQQGKFNLHCVGSIVDEKEDKIYWLISGIWDNWSDTTPGAKGIDIIAEYSYLTKEVLPVVVDVFDLAQFPSNESGRVLNFDKSIVITGINIIDDYLFWTDNNTEPKKINITRCKLGSNGFSITTNFFVKDLALNSSTPFINTGPIRHEHVTVAKKSPQTAPSLEMKNTTRLDTDFDGVEGEISTTISATIDIFLDTTTGEYFTTPVLVTFNTTPDFKIGDILEITSSKKKIVVEVTSIQSVYTGVYFVQILNWDNNLVESDFEEEMLVKLRQPEALFQFKFPRFGYRYKYEDGEYSTFSPFSEVAFLPGEYDYLPKKGHNLGMVNNVRFLGVKDFVDERSIPEDVIAIDILYKESNSPIIYSVKTVDRAAEVPGATIGPYNEWNAIGPLPTDMAFTNGVQLTKGFVQIESEMIHAMLPSNQLLRVWDNVPRKALAQEIVGNRLIYANYLQNYNLFNSKDVRPTALYTNAWKDVLLLASDNIIVDLKLGLKSSVVGALTPEQVFSKIVGNYGPAKSIKSLRSYQVGITYIDEFGRETPIFSNSKTSGNTFQVEKANAPLATKFSAQALNTAPEWAKSFKFFIKETSNEYYNLAMDRWYPAGDGNIWLSFPSSERNKVDIDTFLILKKQHNSNIPVQEKARYRILALENEAPIFIKTKRESMGWFFDDPLSSIGDTGVSGTGFPLPGGTFILFDITLFAGLQARLEEESLSEVEFRLFNPAEGASKWYKIDSANVDPVSGRFKIVSNEEFGEDMGVTSPDPDPATAYTNRYTTGTRVEFVRREVKERAEFEGRFFAKILHDATISNAVIGAANSTDNLVTISSIRAQYISPEASRVLDGTYSGSGSWYGFDEDLISISNDVGEDNYHHDSMSDGEGEAYWDMAANTPNTASASTGWFIDRVEAFRNVKQSNLFFNTFWADDTTLTPAPAGVNPNWTLGAVADASYITNITLPAQSNAAVVPFNNTTWVSGLFAIPGGVSTAYTNSWRGNFPNAMEYNDYIESGGQLQLVNTGTHSSSLNQYLNQTDLHAPHSETTMKDEFGVTTHVIPDYPLMDVTTPFAESITKSEHGLIPPSFGIGDQVINGTTSVIHLSYAGVGNDETFTPITDASTLNTYFSAAAWAGSYIQEQGFIDAISTHGTLWRWKEDPGQVLYKTQNPLLGGALPTVDAIYANPYTYTVNAWNNNQQDIIDGMKGIALWNYCRFQDYTWTHEWQFAITDDTSMSSGDSRDCTSAAIIQPEVAAASTALASTGWHGRNPLGFPDNPRQKYNWISASMASHCTEWKGDDNSIANPLAGDPFGLLWPTSGNTSYAYKRLTETAQFGGLAGNWGIFRDHYVNHNQKPTSGGWTHDFTGTFGTAHFMYPMHLRNYNLASSKRRRYTIHAVSEADGTELGGTGPHFYLPTNDPENPAHFDNVGVPLTTVPSTVAPGIRPDGMYSGFVNPSGTYTLNDASGTGVIHTNIPSKKMTDGINPDSPAPGSVTWVVLGSYIETADGDSYSSTNPAIWETEPKEDIGLEIYHEVGQIYPTELNESTFEQFIGPIDPANPKTNTIVTCYNPISGTTINLGTNTGNDGSNDFWVGATAGNNGVALYDHDSVLLDWANPSHSIPPIFSRLVFTRPDGSVTETAVTNYLTVAGMLPTGVNGFELAQDLHNYPVTLPWFNCYSFGNGVESNRIRDDYNQVFIDKGPKVSTTLEEPYAEERRSSGLIYSGIYNSNSGVNNLNQFIQAEKITKDLNPGYGTIQKLYTRNTDLLTFCEDKVFKILANKDALFNADGNPQLIATDRVLGQSTPFAGDFGISKNPESFAADGYRNYFVDRVRGSVLRLSQDGMTLISNIGMTDWFSDNLKNSNRIIGSFDDRKGEYNINLDSYDYNNYEVYIKAVRYNKGVLPPIYTPWKPWGPELIVEGNSIADHLQVGDSVTGIGIPPLTIIVGKVDLGGGLWAVELNQYPSIADVVVFGDPTPWNDPFPTTPTPSNGGRWKTRITSSKQKVLGSTLSFSEKNRGWVSFKSFEPESGVSLNNNYYTFKFGQLWEHHLNPIHNNFYSEMDDRSSWNQYDSSVEVLFNEAPGSVKSFQTLNYEGSQSRITADIDNSGEYWDNNTKLGWYVSEMRTNLQEADIHEFKDKEGKWFSQIKGVTTEWIDDGTAGNIDTNEFSYQGVDELGSKTIASGGYTSWDCDIVDPDLSIYGCVERLDLSGVYATELLCLSDTTSACSTVCLNQNTVIVNAIQGQTGFCELGGSMNVNVTLNPLNGSTSWTVKYENLALGLIVNDPTSYTPLLPGSPISSIVQTVVEADYGTWKATITDSNGCTNTIDFDVKCIPAPCYSSTSNYNATQPSISCDDGTINVDIFTLGAGASTCTVKYVGITGAAIGITHIDPVIYSPGQTTNTQTGLVEGDWQYIITSDLGCEDVTPFTITCPPLPPPCPPVSMDGITTTPAAPGVQGCLMGSGPNGTMTFNLPSDPTITITDCWKVEVTDISGALVGTSSNVCGSGQVTFNLPHNDYQLTFLWVSGTALNNSCEVDTEAFTVPCQCTDGCTDATAINYDPLATCNDGSCLYSGCTDPVATNYNPVATVDDGSCNYACAAGTTDILDNAFETFLETHTAAAGNPVGAWPATMGDGIMGNQSVCTDNINGVLGLLMFNEGISDLTGIEDFIALQDLQVKSNNISSINLSSNIDLHTIDVANNSLTTLDVSSNTNLQVLRCGSNLLSSIDISNNTALQALDIIQQPGGNIDSISSIDFSNNPNISSFQAGNNLSLVGTLELTNQNNLFTISPGPNYTVVDIRNTLLNINNMENVQAHKGFNATSSNSIHTVFTSQIYDAQARWKTSNTNLGNAVSCEFCDGLGTCVPVLP